MRALTEKQTPSKLKWASVLLPLLFATRLPKAFWVSLIVLVAPERGNGRPLFRLGPASQQHHGPFRFGTLTLALP